VKKSDHGSKKKHNTTHAKNRGRGKWLKQKQVAKIAKKVVINNQEMLRRETGVQTFQFLDGNKSSGPLTTIFKGLNGRSPCNFKLHPLNYGWENERTNELDEASHKIHFTGEGIHPRYLKTKILFKFPQAEDAIEKPMRIQLVWGFIKRPFMFTPYTTPEADEASITELKQLALKQVEREYDSPLDQLHFNVKRPNNYVITGKRWIRPDRRHRIGAIQNYVVGADGLPDPRSSGGPPDIKETISWTMGKQWRLQRSGDVEDEDEQVFCYNNEQYIPFWLVYNPDYANVRQDPDNYDSDGELVEPPGGGDNGNPVPEANRIQVTHNSCMWYNDA